MSPLYLLVVMLWIKKYLCLTCSKFRVCSETNCGHSYAPNNGCCTCTNVGQCWDSTLRAKCQPFSPGCPWYCTCDTLNGFVWDPERNQCVSNKGGCQCEDGKYCGADGCQVCLNGHVPNSEKNGCEACKEGEYALSGSPTCSRCLADNTPTQDRSGCQSCPSGSYAAPGSPDCFLCNPGSVPKDDRSDCTECSSGQYVTPGTSSCSQCNAGSVPNPAKTGCTSCEDGTYAASGSSSCSQCSAGQIPNPAKTGCSPCSEGMYATPGSSTCSTCSVGSVPNSAKTGCEQCPPGKIASAGSSACSECQAGFIPDTSQSSCVACSQGEYSKPGSSTCSTCPAGSALNNAKNGCDDCNENYYTNQSGQSTCQHCPAGAYNYGTGNIRCCYLGEAITSTGCIKCGPGYVVGPPPYDKCVACDAGSYSDKEKNTQCIQCAVNTYQPKSGASDCIDCSGGSFQPLTGQTDCKPCHDYCAACDGTAENCSQCIENEGIELHGNACLCKTDSGYYEHFVNGKMQCDPCHEFCKTCKDNSKNCQSCLKLPGVNQVSNKCLCNGEGYFLKHNTIMNKDECISCHTLCSSCYGVSSTECYSCKSEKRATLVEPNTCTCSDLYYYDSALESCERCNKLCKVCFGSSAYECSSCLNSFSVENKPWCVASCDLLSGYYRNSAICKGIYLHLPIACHKDCRECFGPEHNQCASCSSPDKVLYEGQCENECPPGFYNLKQTCLSNFK